MKKNYFMLAATTMLFAACAQNDVVNEMAQESAQQAIGFETFANKQTRAENSTAAYSWELSEHHDNFWVWGGKELIDGSFQSVYATSSPGKVTHDGSSWNADPKQYWDKAAKEYYFIAAAPQTLSWKADATVDHNFSTASLSLEGFSLKGTNLSVKNSTKLVQNNWKGDQDIDLLISENTKVNREVYYGNSATNTVQLNFSHILSRLNIIVKKDASVKPTVTITELVVDNLKSKGTFREANNSAVNTSPGTKARWQDQDVNYSIIGATGIVTDEEQYFIQSLIIPQKIKTENIDINGSSTEAQAYFKIAYKIGDESFTGYYNLAKALSKSDFTFGEGWQNTLTITINPTTILFSGSVAEWATVTDGGEIE